MFWIVVIVFIVVLDQVSKYLIVNNIELTRLIPVIDNFFFLTYIRNKGAAWSILQNGRLFFIILTPVIAAVLICFLLKYNDRLLRLSLSMILGGALGNFIDRLFAGSVVDFLEFHFGNYSFPTFNVADIFVTTGTILLAYYLLFIYKERNEYGRD